jgi:indolepyruvate ferredoxin oxidoreductase alpha subunit
VIKKIGGEGAAYATDIGCYALGIAPPLCVGDLLVCMGSSVATAQGISRVTGRSTIATLGDSTFFHAAIPGLVNAVYNNAKVTLVVLDNATTAMTGHQPHPGTGMTGMGSLSEKVSIEKVVEGCGVKYLRTVDPFKVKEASEVLKEALQQPGPSVVVFRAPCVLLSVRERRRQGIKVVPFKVTAKCTDCMTCIRLLGCPALVVVDGKVGIGEALCTACGLCASVCPYSAIEGRCLK